MFAKIKGFFARLLSRKEPLELSYSKISAYTFCPWKYKLLYVDGMKVPPNPYISLGLSIHKTLELFHKNGYHDMDDLLDLYNQVWVNEGFQTPQQTLHFYDKGKKMLSQYYEFSQSRKSEIVAVEKEFRTRVGPRFLRGIIDRIDRLPDGSYEVIDYKTHAEMWEPARIDSDLQLTFYALGCRDVLRLAPVHLSYFFLAHNKAVPTQRTPAQEREALALMESVARKIEKGEYPANNAQCTRCDFKQTCRFSTAKGAHGKSNGH